MSCRTATWFFSGSMFKNKSNHNRFLKFCHLWPVWLCGFMAKVKLSDAVDKSLF